jgi:hypothetical protein
MMNQEQQTAMTILPLVARLQGGKLANIEGSDIFSIAAGWPADMLRKEPGVVTVQTPTELEVAVQSRDLHTIFVPRDTFGWSMLERILTRNSLAKTIFWEK